MCVCVFGEFSRHSNSHSEQFTAAAEAAASEKQPQSKQQQQQQHVRPNWQPHHKAKANTAICAVFESEYLFVLLCDDTLRQPDTLPAPPQTLSNAYDYCARSSRPHIYGVSPRQCRVLPGPAQINVAVERAETVPPHIASINSSASSAASAPLNHHHHQHRRPTAANTIFVIYCAPD